MGIMKFEAKLGGGASTGDWREVEAFCDEDAASSFCEILFNESYERSPLQEAGEDCEVYVRISGQQEVKRFSVTLEYDRASFYAHEMEDAE